MKPSECTTAADIDALAREMFGQVLPFSGVSHVTATWANPEGELWVMAITEHTPKSEHDFFMLNLARARADAIVVTGKVLREEPTLRYTLQGAGASPEALAQWRVECAKRTEPPMLIVLTSGRGLDPKHPALSGEWARPVIFTSKSAVLPHVDAEIVRVDQPGARAAVTWAKKRADTISIEAGPSTALSLYDDMVDELLLGVYEAPELPEGIAVGKLRNASDSFGEQTGSYELGAWTFSRQVHP